MLPVKSPHVYYNEQKGKEYAAKQNKKEIFCAKEHILGNKITFLITKNNQEISMFSLVKENEFRPLINMGIFKGLEYYMSFITEQSKKFLMVLLYLQNLTNKSVYVKKAQIDTVLCGVHERGRNKEETEFEMIIENIFFDDSKLFPKEFYSLMNLIKTDLERKEKNECEFFVPLIKEDTLDNLLSMDIDIQSKIANKNNIKIHGIEITTSEPTPMDSILRLLETPAPKREEKNKDIIKQILDSISIDLIEKHAIKFLPLQREAQILQIIKNITPRVKEEILSNDLELSKKFKKLTNWKKENCYKQMAEHITRKLYKVLEEQRERNDNEQF